MRYTFHCKTEQNKRNYGYDIQYRNLRIDEIIDLPNLVITALDKHYWRYLYLFPKDTILIIHDPTELKGKGNPLPDLLHKFKIITIRETVQKLLKEKYNIESEFKYHPFYEYPKIKDNHNYDVPEIISYKFKSHNKDYNKWFSNNIKENNK